MSSVMERKWYNIELERDEADTMKAYLDKYGYTYESSEAFNLIHIEVYLTPDEFHKVFEYAETTFGNKPVTE